MVAFDEQHPPPQVSSPFPQNAWKRTCQHPMQMASLFARGAKTNAKKAREMNQDVQS